MTPPLDCLRILIALAVIRNTPADQTHASYILSLRDSFPSSEEPPFDFWKGHARQLERECIELRAALGKLQIRSFIDTHTSSAHVAGCEPLSSDSNDLRATRKKKSTELEVANLADILKFGKTGIRSGWPFEALATFLQLCTLSDRPDFPKKAFFMAARDVCRAISSAFDDAIKERTNLKALQVVQATICAVIDKAVPLVVSWLTEDDEALSRLFENFLDSFITPVIPAFLIVSERNLSYMEDANAGDSQAASGPNHPADYVDGRVSILALLQIALSHIRVALSNPGNKDSGAAKFQLPKSLVVASTDFSVMIHSLILTILRHLRDILQEGDTENNKKSSRRCRIKRLAVKDTLWYLCSTVHFLLDLQDRVLGQIFWDDLKDISRQKHRLGLLTHTILDFLVDLVLYQDRKRALDFTGRHDRFAAKTNSKASIESQEFDSPSTLNNEDGFKAINYLILDDMEYRMFLSIVERFLGIDSIP